MRSRARLDKITFISAHPRLFPGMGNRKEEKNKAQLSDRKTKEESTRWWKTLNKLSFYLLS